MKLNSSALLQAAVIVTGVAVIWLSFFKVNDWLFSQLAYTDRAHWIFLPAALRIIAILLFGGVGALGLMAGAYLTLPSTNPDEFGLEVAFAVSSGLAPLIAVVICQRFFRINRDLAGLRGSHIIALAVANALANTVLMNSLMLAAERHHGNGLLAATIFVGDLFGAALMVLTIALGISAYTRLRRQ